MNNGAQENEPNRMHTLEKSFRKKHQNSSKYIGTATFSDLPKTATATSNTFLAACVANLDDDEDLDIWTIDHKKFLKHVNSDLPGPNDIKKNSINHRKVDKKQYLTSVSNRIQHDLSIIKRNPLFKKETFNIKFAKRIRKKCPNKNIQIFNTCYVKEIIKFCTIPSIRESKTCVSAQKFK